MRLRQNKENIQGRSLILNILFIILNIVGGVLIVKSFLSSAVDNSTQYLILGVLFFIPALIALYILKGLHMFSFVARAFVGGLFIVSGLVKANDPWGFAFKLEEYFSPMGLTLDYPFFEWFHGYELELSILICVAEIILGVAVIVGGKIKLTSWLLVFLMIGFTWLTYYTSSCVEANEVLSAAGELATRDCVTDCGCFGDALKGSVGRSLTPKESFWKDIILFYFVFIIFINQWKIKYNTTRQNWIMSLSALVFVIFFSWVFGWYFPIFFYIFTMLGAFVIGNMNIGKLDKAWKMAIFVGLVSLLFSVFTVMYLPIKDYRAYAIGNNIHQKQHDGVPAVIERTYFYKDINTKKIKTVPQSEWTADYSDKNKWEFIESKDVIFDHGQPNSISDFLLTIDYEKLKTLTIKNNVLDSLVNNEFDNYYETKLVQKSSLGIDTISAYEYQAFIFDTAYYGPDTVYYEKINEFTGLLDPTTPYNVDVTEYILSLEKVFLVTIRDISSINEEAIPLLNKIYEKAKENKIPFYILSPASDNQVADFRNKYNVNAPFLSMDGVEIKIIIRSNPGLVLLKKATVIDKWPSRSIPTFEYIQSKYLN